MENIIRLHDNKKTNNGARFDLKKAAEYLGIGYQQLRKIVVEKNMIPYRNDGLGYYQKPSILVEDLDKYTLEKTVFAKKGF